MSHVRALALLLSLGVCACTSAPLSEEDPRALFAAGENREPWNPAVVRARAAEPRFDVTSAPVDALATLELNLFDDVYLDANLTRVVPGASGHIWQGTLDEGDGEVTLAVVDGTYAGTVRADGKLYQIGHRHDGHYVAELDEDRFDEQPPIIPDVRGEVAVPPPMSADGGDTRVDVMVMYTTQAMNAAGGGAAMAAVIDLAVAETNQGYAASGVHMHLNLVHQGATTYDETNFNWSDALSRLQGKTDGFMDEVHALRNQVGADHVVLIVETVGPYAGLGYLMEAIAAPYFAEYAFSVVARDYATGAYTFAHELGHNMGSSHDHANASSGFYPYSFGMQVPSAGFRTVMAYACTGCVRVNRWSSPLVTYNGVPTGVADYADNARSLNGTRVYSAAFRAQVDGPPTDVATMTSPVDGSTLSGSQVTFTWNDAGALAYHLDVESDDGDVFHDGDHGQLTSATVSDLPTDGTPLVVRLWSESTTAGWRYHEYHYTAFTTPPPPPPPATILAPSPGSSLPAGDITFVWLGTSGATAYRLRVGTAASPGAYHDVLLAPTDRTRVAGLPQDGSAIVATLSTETSHGWSSTQAHYTAFAPHGGPTAILSPVNGSHLSGITETFRWVDFGAAQYWLMIRRADGSYAFSGSVGTATQYTFSGLPTNGGAVEVTLFAQLVDGWVQWTSSYVAASNL